MDVLSVPWGVRQPSMVLLDFDGVLAPNATRVLHDVAAEVVSTWASVESSEFRRLFGALTAFPPAPTWELVVRSLGLPPAATSEIMTALHDATGSASESLTIDGGIDDLTAICARLGTPIAVCSSMTDQTPRRRAARPWFADRDYVALEGGSKADPATFRRVVRTRGQRADRRCLVVDDSPWAIRAAHLAGLTTVQVRSALDPPTAGPGSEYADLVVDDLAEVAVILERAHPSI